MLLKLPKPKTALQWGMLIMVIKVSFSFSKIIPYTDGMDNVLSLLAVAVLTWCIIYDNFYSPKLLIIYGLVSVCALYTSIVTSNYGFLITVIMCLAIRKHNIDSIIRFIFRYELFFLIVHICIAVISSCLFGTSISSVETTYGWRSLRYNFGLGNANTVSVYAFNLIAMWVWLNFEKIKAKHIVNIIIISIILYFFTKTRTSFIEMLILAGLLIITYHKNKSGKFFTAIAKSITAVFSIIFYALIRLYINGNEVALLMDKFLNARIRLGAYAYNQYGLTILGRNFLNFHATWDEQWKLNWFTFDCTYSYLTINMGIIWIILIALIFWKLASYKSNKINIAIIVFSLYAVSEVHALNPFLCYPIILTALLFDKKGKQYDYSRLDMGSN
jgi:hypothetical protein